MAELDVSFVDGFVARVRVEDDFLIAAVIELASTERGVDASHVTLCSQGERLNPSDTVAEAGLALESRVTAILSSAPTGGASIEVSVVAQATGRTLTIDIAPSTTIFALKQRLEAEYDGGPPALQRLVLNGEVLDDAATAADAEIEDASVVTWLKIEPSPSPPVAAPSDAVAAPRAISVAATGAVTAIDAWRLDAFVRTAGIRSAAVGPTARLLQGLLGAAASSLDGLVGVDDSGALEAIDVSVRAALAPQLAALRAACLLAAGTATARAQLMHARDARRIEVAFRAEESVLTFKLRVLRATGCSPGWTKVILGGVRIDDDGAPDGGGTLGAHAIGDSAKVLQIMESEPRRVISTNQPQRRRAATPRASAAPAAAPASAVVADVACCSALGATLTLSSDRVALAALTVDQVSAFLVSQKLSKFVATFRESEVDGVMLDEIHSIDDLEDFEGPKKLQRKKLLRLVAEARENGIARADVEATVEAALPAVTVPAEASAPPVPSAPPAPPAGASKTWAWGRAGLAAHVAVAENGALFKLGSRAGSTTEGARGTVGWTSGVHAWTVQFESQTGSHGAVGVCTAAHALQRDSYAHALGNDQHSWGWHKDGGVYFCGERVGMAAPFARGDQLTLELDLTGELGVLTLRKVGAPCYSLRGISKLAALFPAAVTPMAGGAVRVLDADVRPSGEVAAGGEASVWTWEWEDGNMRSDSWQRFDTHAQMAIAATGAALPGGGGATLTLVFGTTPYLVDTTALTQTNTRTNYVRRIRRVPITATAAAAAAPVACAAISARPQVPARPHAAAPSPRTSPSPEAGGGAAAAAAAPVACPAGHALSAFDCPRDGFGCDVCSARKPIGARMHGCRECNYDLCELCYAKGGALFGVAVTDVNKHVGRRVKRGPDWKWSTQDGGGCGTISATSSVGWVEVKWDVGAATNSYRTDYKDLVFAADSAAAGGAAARSARLQLYALVTLAAPDDGKPRAGLEPGELGIIIKDDADSRPFKVRVLSSGAESDFYKESELAAAAPVSGRPTVGDYVVLARALSKTNGLVIGERGHIVKDDRDTRPWKVRTAAGTSDYYREDELMRVPAPAVITPRCPSANHVMVVSDGSGHYASYICNECGAHRSGERWFCARCRDDFCFACKPVRSAAAAAPEGGRDAIVVGSRVRVKGSVSKPAFGWGSVKPGDVGTVVVVRGGGKVTVDFAKQAGWSGKMDEMECAAAARGTIAIGSRVRVKGSVSKPAFGWGSVKPGDVGTVLTIDAGGKVTVDFAKQTRWSGKVDEMECAPLAIAGAAALGSSRGAAAAKARPIVGDRVVLAAGYEGCGDASGGCLTVGQVGVVLKDDSSSKPFHVRCMESGREWWYQSGAIEVKVHAEPLVLRYKLESANVAAGGLRVRKLPTLSSAQVASVEFSAFPGDTIRVAEVRGDWVKVHPLEFVSLQRSRCYVAHDPRTEGWCAWRLKGKTLLQAL